MHSSQRLRALAGLGLVTLTTSCERQAPESRPDSLAAAAVVQLVDSTIKAAVAGRDGWGYEQSAAHDLDGDGQPERVVLTARVELMRGRPAWDDGQQWQVYIEEPDSSRTYIYAQFVQLGTVTMRVGEAVDGNPASVILIEHLPDRLGVYEIQYQAPGRFTAIERFERVLDPRGDVASPKLP